MRGLLSSSFCLCLLLSATWVAAQEAVPEPLQIGPSGEAYLKSIRYRSVDTDVSYFDPTRSVPRLETGQEPAPPSTPKGQETSLTVSSSRLVVLALVTVILIGLGVLVLRGAGSFTLSLQSDAQNPERGRRMARNGMSSAPTPPAELGSILATPDRQLALVMLAQTALARTIAANGVILQASWTMRDALRHVPKGQTHLDALRNLVMAGERVLFGNRAVTEAEFQSHVVAIRPLLSGGPA